MRFLHCGRNDSGRVRSASLWPVPLMSKLPSQSNLVLRRTIIECYLYAYPRTPFAASRRSPQGETRNLESPSFCLPDRNGAGRSPEEHRIFLAKDLTPLSSVACGDTCWPGFKVFALCAGYAHILARLRSVADFCLWKGALALRHVIPVTQK